MELEPMKRPDRSLGGANDALRRNTTTATTKHRRPAAPTWSLPVGKLARWVVAGVAIVVVGKLVLKACGWWPV